MPCAVFCSLLAGISAVIIIHYSFDYIEEKWSEEWSIAAVGFSSSNLMIPGRRVGYRSSSCSSRLCLTVDFLNSLRFLTGRSWSMLWYLTHFLFLINALFSQFVCRWFKTGHSVRRRRESRTNETDQSVNFSIRSHFPPILLPLFYLLAVPCLYIHTSRPQGSYWLFVLVWLIFLKELWVAHDRYSVFSFLLSLPSSECDRRT